MYNQGFTITIQSHLEKLIDIISYMVGNKNERCIKRSIDYITLYFKLQITEDNFIELHYKF